MSTAWYKSNVLPKLIRQWTGFAPRTVVEGTQSPRGSLRTLPSAGCQERAERVVQLWSTTCIVSNFGRSVLDSAVSAAAGSGSQPVSDSTSTPPSTHLPSSAACCLINPANPQLSGVSQFPYFPRGGPVPNRQPSKDLHHIMGYVSQWGGMEAGDGMMFASVVVDGLVHQMGGTGLRRELSQFPTVQSPDVKCPHGSAIVTTAGRSSHSELVRQYDRIIHTAPPFYLRTKNNPPPSSSSSSSSPSTTDLLRQCYVSSLHAATNCDRGTPWSTHRISSESAANTFLLIASPLIGAGCRGFPVHVAADIAAEAAVQWLSGSLDLDQCGKGKSDRQPQQVLAFGIPSLEIQQALADRLDLAHAKQFC